jgi:multimeric flavodoxin WrbA
MAMKVVALMGSPRKGGNTDTLTDEFIAGAESEGAECDKIYLDDLSIRPIAAVGDDWDMRVDLRADDDARRVLEQVASADIVVFATPVYWQGVTGQMKCLVDRFSAYYMADWLRQGMRDSGLFVITAYGNPSADESHWVTEPVQAWARGFKARYLGQVGAAVARWGGVREMPEVLKAAREAGAEAVRAMSEP